MSNIFIHQSDERTFFLASLLDGVYFKTPTHVFAPNVIVDADAIGNIEDGADIILGRITDEADALANSKNIKVFNMAKDEKFQAVNSRLTAEGALAIIIGRSKKSIAECNALVMGFGRTGAAVTRLLHAIGINLDIATNSSLRPAYAFANKVVPSKNFDFAPYDVIINTVPEAIVSDREVLTMKKSAVYVDLASRPAINLEFAKHLGIDADIYPKLPAKTCPLSAAKAMRDYIMEVKHD